MTQWDVIVCGGGTGGVAAALACARLGKRVLLSEPTDWIGGQLTSQAVPPDENPWIETHGGTRSYRSFREGVRAYYRSHYPLTAEARANVLLNPGLGYVSRLCHEPKVALAVLEGMLAPYVSSGLVTLMLRHVPVYAETNGDRVVSITLQSLETGHHRDYAAPYVLDATEMGDLLALAGVEHVTGSESGDETGEPHAVGGPARPGNQQGATYCFAMSYHPGESHVIDKPEGYERWRAYQPSFWPGPLLGWADLHPFTNEARTHTLFGPNDDPAEFAAGGEYQWGRQGLWHYRRIRAQQHMADGGPETTLVNWPMNDYWLKPLYGGTMEDAQVALTEAKTLSLSLLYWLQTEAPHPNSDARGYPGLRLRPDIVGTSDGLAKHIYVREARRIVAETTVLEQHIAAEGRSAAEAFPDAVGIGCYRIDLHPTTEGDRFIDIGCHPFQVPLGALIPVRVENLLPACKNLGVTHITNGALRLHPTEWAIGEASGALACFCLDHNAPPRGVRSNPGLLEAFQASLTRQGIPYQWPALRPV